MDFYRYILAFGSNLGNRELNCKRGEAHLSQFGQVLRSTRPIYTEPLKSDLFGVEENQDLFLNYIIEFQCSLDPKSLYQEIVRIEDEVGHNRLRKWAPRHLDIDILFASLGSCILSLEEKDGLHIPHREIQKRPFLLELLRDFYPNL